MMAHQAFLLRPGVAMPDWSLVADPVGRDALAASMEAAGRAEKWSGLDAAEDTVWQAILRTLARGSPAPHAAGLATATGLPEAAVCAILSSLRRRDLVVLDADGTGVTAAYPFCTWTTGHRVALAGWGEVESLCAIDALGTGAMLGCEAVVTSRCAECGNPIRVTLGERGRALTTVEPIGALVWSGIRYADNCGATSGCQTKVFACSDAHLDAWRARAAADVPGFRLTMGAALQVGAALFVPMLAHCDPGGDDPSTTLPSPGASHELLREAGWADPGR